MKDKTKQSFAHVRPSSFLDARDYLQAVYSAIKSREPSYSYAIYAQDLGIQVAGIIHQIIRRRRSLSHKMAVKIATKIGLAPDERKYFLALSDFASARTEQQKRGALGNILQIKSASSPDALSKSQIEYFKSWYHPVIRELAAVPGFRDDPEWVRARLRSEMSQEQAAESLALLKELGLITFDKQRAQFIPSDATVSTGHEVADFALMSYHEQMIAQARVAMHSVEAKQRDISAVTISIPKEAIPRVKTMIHQFQMQLLQVAEEAPADRVYQINVQFFPWTNDD